MRLLLWFAGFIAFGYGMIVLLMYLNQRSFLYFPERERTAPAAAGFTAARELTLETTDGERLIAWHLPPKATGRSFSIFTVMAVRCACGPSGLRR